MGRLQNKTLPIQKRERNEVSCEHRSRISRVPVVVEPIVVLNALVTVAIQVTNIEIAIGVAVICGAPPIAPPVEFSSG